ncbi:MAG: amino acid ABC transporter substrate-binding protein [Desulfobacterales bacterium]|nr:MAG: amino acid ABC transporter substrate-binding protein [Desulfobacterales bacterium]
MKKRYPLLITVPAILFGLLGNICLGDAVAGPLTLGASVSLEGKYAETSFMVENAYKLWVENVNQRGGILGRSVKLILYDDQSREEKVRFIYEKLITEDHVDFVLAPYGTPLTLVASEVTERHGYVMVAGAAAGEEIWERGFKNIFGIHALSQRYFIGFLDLLARYRFKSLGIVFEKTSFNQSAAEGARDWAFRFGLIPQLNAGFDEPQSELPELIKELQAVNPDGVIVCSYPPDSYEFIRLITKAAYTPRALACAIAPALPDFFHKIGKSAEGVFGPSLWEADKRLPYPGTADFIDDFIKSSGKVPSYHAGGSFGACQILHKAIIQTQSFNHAQIRDAIASLDTITVTGRFKVDDQGRQIGHNPLLIQWQKGKKEIVYPRKMRTALPVFK